MAYGGPWGFGGAWPMVKYRPNAHGIFGLLGGVLYLEYKGAWSTLGYPQDPHEHLGSRGMALETVNLESLPLCLAML